MNEPIEILRPGAIVSLNGEPARITAACVRPGPSVTYETVWWCNGARHSEWVTAGELDPNPDAPKLPIGFRPEESAA